MSASAANLVDYVMPKAALRQWVLTFPFAWRKRLAFNGALLGALVRKFADAVLAFYRRRVFEEHGVRGQSGAVLVVQRTSSDLRLNPQIHALVLDGVYHDAGEDKPTFFAVPKLTTEDVAEVLADATGRMTRYLQRRGLIEEHEDGVGGVVLLAPSDSSSDGELAPLAESAISGVTPPAGPAWRRGSEVRRR